APGAARRRLPGGRRDDALPLPPHPDDRARRYPRAVLRGILRAFVLAAVVAAVAAGCGSSREAAQKPALHGPGNVVPKRPKPPSSHRVLVTVVDGDLSRPVARAHVRLGRSHGVTNRRGAVVLRVRRRTASLVTVRAHGYSP